MFWSRGRLINDAVGRSRYERFYSVRSNLICERKSKIEVFEDVRESPVELDAFEGTFACEVEATNSRTHFTEYPEVFPKIPDYTRRAHVHRDVK